MTLTNADLDDIRADAEFVADHDAAKAHRDCARATVALVDGYRAQAFAIHAEHQEATRQAEELNLCRARLAALQAKCVEVAEPWKLPEGTKLVSRALDCILTRNDHPRGPFDAPADPAWYDLPPYIDLSALARELRKAGTP